jgi:hypothetical protein
MPEHKQPLDAATIMMDFADRSGLTSDRPPQRYLWTDAFAVCNYLTLYERTGEGRFLSLARDLVKQVHRVLGRHRPDDPRTGWISGLDEERGARHPTQGGLRIGKPRPERAPGEPYAPREEWNRDGQYYHYLTKWMVALHRIGQTTGKDAYHQWAVELAQAAHAAFVHTTGTGHRRMYWKMSIDLSRPLVDAMGQHDPLDGLVTYCESQSRTPDAPLKKEIAELVKICRGQRWATQDALGIGGLLTVTYRAARLVVRDALPKLKLLPTLLKAAQVSLSAYAQKEPLRRPVAHRLAFRELGLAVGLHALERLMTLREQRPAPLAELRPADLASLRDYLPLRDEIEAFWLRPKPRQSRNWVDHREINAVMLATTLAPDGYLGR